MRAAPDRRRPAAICQLLVVLGASGIRAQEPEGPVFGERLEVRVVNVEAVVTDGRGRRVEGLGPEDFRLLVDGREVEIGYFSEIREGIAAESSAPGAAAGKAPFASPSVGSGRAPTNYLLFVDEVFAIGAQRDLVLRRIAAQLPDFLREGDLMAAVAFDGRQVDLLTGWSDDQERLAAALEAAADRRAFGLFRRMEARLFRSGLDVPTAPASDRAALEGAEVYRRTGAQEELAGRVALQLRSIVAAAVAAMRAMPAPDGRKVMLLLSGGWPFQLIQIGVEGGGPDSDVSDTWRFDRGAVIFQELVNTANHLGYTLYPVDVPGATGTALDIEGNGPALLPGAMPLSESSKEATLLHLARETGGRALLNDLRVRAIESAAEDTGAYYWLGFQAQRQEADRRHALRVEVLRPGLRVRSRREYVDVSEVAAVEMIARAGLLFPAVVEAGTLEVEVGKARPAEGREVDVPLRIGVPTEDLTYLELHGRYFADVSLSLGVMDRRGTLSRIQTLPLRLNSSTRPSPGARALFGATVRIWRERHELVVTVRDRVSGRVISRRVTVRP